MTRPFIVGWTLALALIQPNAVSAQALDSSQIRRVDSVFAEFDRTDRPGCSLAIAKDGAQRYARGYGMANLEYGLANRANSIFHVASISKQFTAYAVGLLAERGLLSVDDDVRKFIPELPAYGAPITLRHLMYHTSGIRDQWELLWWAGWREDDPITEDDILRIVARQRGLNFAPGEEYLYSNSGFTLLAIVVKRVSGLRLKEFAQREIFGPLGMRDTHFHNDHTLIVPNRTSAYYRRPDGSWAINIPVFDNDGATSLQTTVEDLLRWEANLAQPTVGSLSLRDQARQAGRLNSSKTTNYGFGLSIETFRGMELIGHGGADAGYRADVFLIPSAKVAVAVACNFAEADPGDYGRRVADILLGTHPPAGAAQRASVRLAVTELDRWVGVYKKTDAVEAWRVTRNDTTLLIDDTPLPALGGGRFDLDGATLEFGAGTTGPGFRIVRDSEPELHFDRVAPPRIGPAELAVLEGHYWSDELEAEYVVEVAGDSLNLRRGRSPAKAMTPLYQDVFATEFGTIRFDRAKSRVVGLTLFGGRVRQIGFRRVPPR